ncbi:lipocalin family protein [uncultured Paracoccus sp.]|uniref:lipocalin family protein n=1 Tax=uncultured Paracoccus sp. TaxID=189685 RepID=UPI002604A1B6|nr:lipocalin family protein [uncultured Paracoccus sp.]
MTPIRTVAVALTATVAASLAARGVMTRRPAGISPVTGFDITRYLGRWYEIARLDHRFERDMTHVTARYDLNPDGSVQVVNRGRRNGRWKEARATARSLGDPATASLAVSFFPGFPGGYHVFELDADYRWAMISGPNRGYLWILSRDPTMNEATYQRLVGIARDKGFDVDGLIRVQQEG